MNNDSVPSLGYSHFIVEPTSSLIGNLVEHNQTIFGETLSQSPQVMPVSSELSKLLEGNQSFDPSQKFSYGTFEVLESNPSWIQQFIPEIPVVDLVLQGSARLISKSDDLVDRTIGTSTHFARDIVQSFSESFQSQANHASGLWNHPNNQFHNALTQLNGAVVAKTGSWVTSVNQSNVMATLKRTLRVAKESVLSAAETFSDRIETGPYLTPEESAILTQAEFRLKENLAELREDPNFALIFETAFGDEFESSEADALVKDVLEGTKEPKIQVVAVEKLKGEGAFGQNTIFLSEELLAQNADNPEMLDAVLLEELGHYFDQELNVADSLGDEGAIFSSMVRGKKISNAEMQSLKEEDDHSVLEVGNQTISIENYYLTDAEKIEIARSSSTPVDGSDRRLYLQAGTVDAFDAALANQQESSTNAPAPVAQTPIDGSDRRLYLQAGTVDAFDAALANQQDPTNRSANVGNGGSVTIGSSQDTLSAIASRYGIQWTDLRKPNGEAFTEEEARLLQIGDQVFLPGDPVEESVDSVPENPRQADLGQPESSVSPYTGMTADAAEAWIQAASEGANPPLDSAVTINAGDTLSAIAAAHGVSWQDLRKTNGEAFTEEEARYLQIGDQVLLPSQAVEVPDQPAPENPRQADLISQDIHVDEVNQFTEENAIVSDYTGMSADAAEAWIIAEEEKKVSDVISSPPENPRQADLAMQESSSAREFQIPRTSDSAEAWALAAEEKESAESEITMERFDDLNEQVQNWQGTDNDPILDQLVKERNIVFESLVSGFDTALASDLEDYTRQGDLFTDAYQKVLETRSYQISNAVDKITDLLHTDRQSGWTPWTDGDREVTSEEVFEAFEVLAKLDDYESNAAFNTLTEEQIEKLESVLTQGDYVESTGLGHAFWAPTRVVGRATWETGDGLLDIPRAIVAGSWTYANSRTNGNSSPFMNSEVVHLAAGAEAANDVLADGNAPFLSNAVRCQRGDNLSCGMLGVEIIVETVGGPVAARVTSVIGRVGSRLLVRFTTQNGDDIVSTITEEAAEEMIDSIRREAAEDVVDDLTEEATEQVLHNTDRSLSQTFDDGTQIVNNPPGSQGHPSAEFPPSVEADIESVEEIVSELGDVPSSWRETVPNSHYEGAPEINTRTVIDVTENSHNLGVQEGRRYAIEELGLSDPDFLVNPFEFHGKYGQGFDDIMRDANGNLVIVEYKGGAARLSSSQMSPEWVASRIQRMRDFGGDLGNFNADILESALEEGKLRGIALSTPSSSDALPGPTRVINEWNYE